MNEIFKKLLSTVLSVSFLSVSTTSLSALADGDYCFKNSKGGYFHQECANDELGKVDLFKSADFVDVENLGPLGKKEICKFNFRAFDEVFEKKKLISTESLNDQYDSLTKEYEDLSNKCKNSPIINWNNKNIFYTISASLIGAVAGLFTFRKAKSPTSNQGKKSIFNQSSQDPKSKQTSKNSHSIVKTVFSTLLGGFIGGLASIIGIGLKNKSEKDKLENEIENEKNNISEKLSKIIHKRVEINDSNDFKAQILNTLLYYLENPESMNDFDMFNCYSEDDGIGGFCHTISAGINYTKEEKESFPQKFKEVAAKIRKNLEENNELWIASLRR